MSKYSAYPRQGNDALAVELAAAGIAILPTRDKRPCIEQWRTRASFDLDQVECWWRQFPGAAPGIECEKSGLLVLDLDRHGGPDGVAAFEQLCVGRQSFPAHPVTETPSGGRHLFFMQPNDGAPLGNGTGRLPPGIDVRGVGGFIIAPGSTRADGERWRPLEGTPSLIRAFQAESIPALPRWLACLLRPPAHRAAPTSFHPRNDDERRVQAALDRIPADDREVWWRVGAALSAHFGEAGRVMWDAWSARSKKFDASVQESVWRSFRGRGITIATIFRYAREHQHAG